MNNKGLSFIFTIVFIQHQLTCECLDLTQSQLNQHLIHGQRNTTFGTNVTNEGMERGDHGHHGGNKDKEGVLEHENQNGYEEGVGEYVLGGTSNHGGLSSSSAYPGNIAGGNVGTCCLCPNSGSVHNTAGHGVGNHNGGGGHNNGHHNNGAHNNAEGGSGGHNGGGGHHNNGHNGGGHHNNNGQSAGGHHNNHGHGHNGEDVDENE